MYHSFLSSSFSRRHRLVPLVGALLSVAGWVQPAQAFRECIYSAALKYTFYTLDVEPSKLEELPEEDVEL
jgi:hypothetical protein